MAKWVLLTARKLKPGTYDDWRKAWETRGRCRPASTARTSAATSPTPERDRRLRDDRGECGSRSRRCGPRTDDEAARAAGMAPFVESVGTDGFYEVIDEVTF